MGKREKIKTSKSQNIKQKNQQTRTSKTTKQYIGTSATLHCSGILYFTLITGQVELFFDVKRRVKAGLAIVSLFSQMPLRFLHN
ncbi:MAG: hypothetical protein ACE5EC_04715 [Phycisphaerae bacterium]